MKHSVFSSIFVLSIIFCQEKLVHINKTYPDGNPKEILIYKQINDELKSTKPLLLIEKINYDRNGNYIKPKPTGLTKKAKQIILGKWARDGKELQGDYVEFKRDGKILVYDNFEVSDFESGLWDVKLEENKSIFMLWNEKGSRKEEVEISFQNRDLIIIDDKRRFYRIK